MPSDHPTPHPAPSSATGRISRWLQPWRWSAQIAFFTLFTLAPVFDLFRYDLNAGHAWLLGMEWRLGLDDFLAGRIGAGSAAVNVLTRLFLPLLGGAALFLWVARRWGRLYCGWLCPHFSVVETINALMLRATGKPSLWEREPLPPWQPDGSPRRRDARWWLLVVPAAITFALCWAVVFLTYLLPPAEIYGNLWRGTLTRNQALFIAAFTTVLSLEFLFARHLFCRYACAVGLFQSLVWMGNRDAMVVGFARSRGSDCNSCLPERQSACDMVCPMRLNPRNIKRHMFTCTQCGQCLSACATTQADNPQGALLHWVSHAAARQNEAGFRPGKAGSDSPSRTASPGPGAASTTTTATAAITMTPARGQDAQPPGSPRAASTGTAPQHDGER